MAEFDGAPCAVKVACTVWSGGKSGDNFKGLPIAIWSEVTGNEAAYGWRRCSTYRDHTCTITFRLILNQVWIMGQGNPCPGGKEEIIEQHNSADY